VIPCHQEVDPFRSHEIDEPVLLMAVAPGNGVVPRMFRTDPRFVPRQHALAVQ
jgi:hypothetical protein